MPKCDKCQYLTYEGYEYKEYYCKLFGYDTPEKYVAWNGEGCRCTQKFLKKLSDENDKADAEYWKEFAKSFEEWGKSIDKEVKDNEKLN